MEKRKKNGTEEKRTNKNETRSLSILFNGIFDI